MLIKPTLMGSWLHLYQGQITWKVQGIEGSTLERKLFQKYFLSWNLTVEYDNERSIEGEHSKFEPTCRSKYDKKEMLNWT